MASEPGPQRVADETGATPAASVAEDLVPTGRWYVDPDRSTVAFRVRKMGLYDVKGRFRTFRGAVEAQPDGRLLGELRIDAASIATGIPPRDAHLRSRQFLAVGTHPEIRFAAHDVEPEGHDVRVRGTMEIRGTRRPLELRAHSHGGPASGGGAAPAAIHLTGVLDRHDFGIRPPQPFEMVVGAEVHLDVNLVLTPAG